MSRRVDNIFKNVRSTVFTQIPLVLVSFFVRRMFIHILGEQYLGLNGLFSNILTVLSVAELGFGSSVTFSLYKPVATDDRETVKSLMRLYRRAYTVIGVLIIAVGLSLTPFLDIFVKEMPEGIAHIELIYVLHVLNSGLSYFFSYKASLLFADQKKYVETRIRTYVKLGGQMVQLMLLIAFKNYILYVVCMALTSVASNLWISLTADRMYPYLKEKDVKPLKDEDKSVIKKNVGAMAFHRFGSVAVFGTDNILMAKFVSLASVGLYSNYVMITNVLHQMLNRFYEDIMASVGNLNALESRERKIKAFNSQNFMSAWLFGFCSICLWHLFTPFISLWLGEEYLLSRWTEAIIVVNFYVSAMRKPVYNTKDAMGLFWNDRLVPLFEVPLNFVISIVLAKPLGIAGVLLGTLISMVLVPFWVEPVILYRSGFGENPLKYFIRYAGYTAVTAAAGLITGLICNIFTGGLLAFVYKAAVCAVVPNAVFYVVYRRTEEFGYLRGVCSHLISKIFKRKNEVE